MAEASTEGARTEVSRVIRAPRRSVYQAFLDPQAVAAWLPPGHMKGEVHVFEPREGGRIRMSLTYRDPKEKPVGKGGKTSADTDTFQGRFAQLVPGETIVWTTEFESNDPEYSGEMRTTFTLADEGDDTKVTVLTENIPPGVRPEDNAAGARSSLDHLAALTEGRTSRPRKLNRS
jgi:uncharacterized protein YndB with AHSA1/START domain